VETTHTDDRPTSSALSAARLRAIADSERLLFMRATPFPHLVTDELVDHDALRAVAAEFPSVDSPTWRGMHEIGPGGFLKIHADFRRHPTVPLQRRLNLLCYLNPGILPGVVPSSSGIVT
jgi:hypothetical protein